MEGSPICFVYTRLLPILLPAARLELSSLETAFIVGGRQVHDALRDYAAHVELSRDGIALRVCSRNLVSIDSMPDILEVVDWVQTPIRRSRLARAPLENSVVLWEEPKHSVVLVGLVLVLVVE